MKKNIFFVLSLILLPWSLSGQIVFTEDFGNSPFPHPDNNFGRMTSPYMPASSFSFGTPYPASGNYDEYAIDNNHYAVVAPGYIKTGVNPGQYYIWTPQYDEAGTVTDKSNTESGAVMVVNAGNTLLPFYERSVPVTADSYYKVSLWMYLVQGPSRLALDVKDVQTGTVLASASTRDFFGENWDPLGNTKNTWTEVVLYFATPPVSACGAASLVQLSVRNDHAQPQGNDYYIDDITVEKVNVVPPGITAPVIACPAAAVCAAGTAQVPLASTVLTNNVQTVASELFHEDFGISNINVNKGRTPSPYMPAGSFEFGNSFVPGANLPPGVNAWDDHVFLNSARISDGFYAIVSPHYINDGWYLTANGANFDDGWNSWWPSNVPDYSGTPNGAAMVINAGNNLNAFYNRAAVMEVGATYRASLQLYVVTGQSPTRLAIDILDAADNTVIATHTTPLYATSQQNQWIPVSLEFTMPGAVSCTSRNIIVSFRNDNAAIDGNDYFVDEIKVEKLQDAPACPPVGGCVDNGITSVNLNDAFTGVVPAGTELVWFATPDHSGTPVANPAAVTVSGTYYAFFYDSVTDCYNVASSTASVDVSIFPQCVSVCTKPGSVVTGGQPSKIGITNKIRQAGWPESVTNGHLVLESEAKGFVITRVADSSAVAEPKKGMLIYDKADACVKLYNGVSWKCIERSCND